ncbi:MAG TPA: hypothetical protein QF861_06040, partial [Alphaproteobacteria bacterium]|nr:hypothetical protein [Alphaproteobacteria bacterium]
LSPHHLGIGVKAPAQLGEREMSSLALFVISHRVFIFANIFAFEYRSRTARVRLQRQRQVLGNQGANISLALAQDLGWFLVLNAEFLNAEGHLAIVGIAAASGPFGNKIGFDPLVDAGGYGLQSYDAGLYHIGNKMNIHVAASGLRLTLCPNRGRKGFDRHDIQPRRQGPTFRRLGHELERAFVRAQELALYDAAELAIEHAHRRPPISIASTGDRGRAGK